ncbi:hypothetical protein J3U57_02245 [Gilliamella sp. B3464]|uniref:hypothetical protein n=1 Tax=unclassified Gilliamella TaxID=2685620 RepID=UPI00226A9F2F|nr:MULTISPECIES: hypothetical protein [unclassified Gilliamella]MCX8711341.1 hypothetical protein [Gilliamella sp. B3468]MCX8750391.1 hypothetical protein [Gilliamella sp. B3464]
MNGKNKEEAYFSSTNHAKGSCIDINYFYNADQDTFEPYIPHYKKLITLGGEDGTDLHNNHMHFDKFQYEIAEVYL